MWRTWVAVMLVPSAALADDELARQLDSRDGFIAALADPVRVRGVIFGNEFCDKRFGAPQLVHGAARASLADCVLQLNPKPTLPLEAQLANGTTVLISLTRRDGTITEIGGASASDLPTVAVMLDSLPSETPAVAWLELCHTASGAITSRKLVRASSVAAFDRALVAKYAAIDRLPPVEIDGRKLAVCEVVIASSDPPPPPPPQPPSIVPPAALEAMRTAGTKQIEPDDATKREIAAAGKTRVIGTFKLCLDATGAFTDVHQIKGTGFAAYDDKILQTIMTTWRYRPFLVKDAPSPVCTAVTFIYGQP